MSLLSGRVRSLALLLLLVPGAAAPALAVDLSAYWEYREVGGDNIDTRSDFQQRYSLGLGPGATYQLTPAISLGAGFGYNRTERDAGDDEGMQTVEEFTPSAQLTLTNDLFTAALAGTITEFRPEDGEDYSTESWDATLNSNWQRYLWPSLRFNYGETTERSSGGDLESEDRRYSAGLDWEVDQYKLFYDYSHSEVDVTSTGSQRGGDSSSESDTHLVRFETIQSFWQKRINLNFSQQYQHTQSDGISQSRMNVSSDVVTNPAAVDPETVSLRLNDALTNNNLNDQAVPVGAGERVHLGVEFGFSQQPTSFTIFLNPLAALTPADAALLVWRLYRRLPVEEEPGAELWELVGVISSTYASQQFVLDIPTLAPNDTGLMVVATNDSAADFVISEVEAFGMPIQNGQNQQLLTNANLRIQLTPTLSASGNLVLEKNEFESETDAGKSESEATRRSLSGSLRWTPSPYVSPSINYSETRDEFSGATDSEQVNRAYSLIVATYPLPTLNVTFGATRTDRFSDGFKTSTSDNFSITTTARIYPDLTANLNLNYILRDRMQEDAPTASGETFTSRFTLNARLSPKLTADLTVNYRDTESESFREVIDPDTDLPQWVKTTTSTTGTDSILSLLYRPSDLLSVRATSTNYWSGTDREDILAFNVNLALLRTRNTRLTFIYTRSQAEVTSNNYRLDGSWDISQYLALQAQFNYRSTDGVDTWGTQAQLSLRL